MSLITEDIEPGPLSKTHIDTTFDVDIPFDPKDFEDILIINESTTPLDPSDFTSLAYNVTAKFRYFNNLLRIGYKSIGSEYNSLGNTYLRNDIRGWFASDRMRLFRNKVYLTLGLELYEDNFSEKDGNPKTDLTTYNAALSYYPGAYLPRISLNFKNYLRDNGVDELYVYEGSSGDTVAVGENNETRNFSVQVAQDFMLFDVNHTASVNWISTDRVDNRSSVDIVDTYSTNLETDLRMFSFRTRYNMPLVTFFNYAWNENSALGGESTYKYQMFDLGGEYKLFNGDLALKGGLRRISAEGAIGSDGAIEYDKNSIRIGAVYRPTLTTYFFVDLNYINFSDKGIDEDGTERPSYDDVIMRARFEKRF